MSRSLRSFLPLAIDADAAVAAFRADPNLWLPDARHVGADRWVIDVGPAGWTRPVTLTLGRPWQVGRTWWRTCSWEPMSVASDGAVPRLLPCLEAELGLAARPSGHVTLLLDGRYDPPGGRLGEVIDAVALGRVATATVEQLLRDIVRGLGASAVMTPVA
jgi:hypothetical protein